MTPILSFVDNGLFISQEKSYEKSNANLFYSYNIIFLLFNQFSLVIKYNKSEVFYFSRSMNAPYIPSLNMWSLRGPILCPKDTWQYLGFFFNKKLIFCQHIHHYTNKTLSTIKNMKMLGNSSRSLSPIYKWLLYRTCVLSIVLYRFQLWYFKEVPLY